MWLLPVLTLVGCGAALLFAGVQLAYSGDAIAEKTGWGRLWVGSFLLAGATSLPELVTDIAAVRLGAVDLAAGDLFGSGLANMLILAVADLIAGPTRVLARATLDHALAACLAIILTALAGAFVLARPSHVAGMGPEALVLLVVYAVGTRAIHVRGERTPTQEPVGPAVGRPVLRFCVATLVVVAAAPAFAWAASRIAVLSGLGNTVVGTLLVGLATSLPELVCTISAVRIGAVDLAVGNLFGSNAFNMAIFAALDVATPGSNIFANLAPEHAISALFGTVLTALALAAIVYRAERRFTLVEPTSGVMVLVYIIAAGVLWHHASSG